MDALLRKDDMFAEMTRGQLREALYIRGANGFEETLTREACLFWLKNWLDITAEVKSARIMTDEVTSAYTALSLFLWSTNFNNDNYLAFLKAEKDKLKLPTPQGKSDELLCPHCGYDVTPMVDERISSDKELHEAKLKLENAKL